MDNALAAKTEPVPKLFRRDFGWFSRAIAQRYFDPIPLPPEAEHTLRELCHRGEVVHVMRTSGVLNFLYLAYALIRAGLPALRAVAPLRWTVYKPNRRLFNDGPVGQRLTKALDVGAGALVFLRGDRGERPSPNSPDDPFLALIARARASPKPIFLVPELFLWSTRARNVKPTFMDWAFGDPEVPGMMHTSWAFLRNYRHAFMRVGHAIDLTAFVRENAGDKDEVLARKVRGALAQHLARETRAIVGPPRKDATRLIDEILRDRTLKTSVEHAAEEKKVTLEAGWRDARRYLNEIASRFSPTLMIVARRFFGWVFNRIYDGIEIDEAGLEKALAVAREAPVVYCPSHKSHVDYLIMSWVLIERGVTPPLVAAGANLSFFPLGSFLRRGGAFFLRRTFKGNRIYAAVFRAYVRKLLKEGYSQEFFIEGGRSRTGKLLSPKLGMVAFEVDAFLDGAQEDVYFVPVAIDYEKIVEAKSYAKELAGGEKKAESIRGLLSTPKVLATKYGRIYLSFEEPISLREFLLQRVGTLDAVPDDKKRTAVRVLAQRITFGISRASTVTPAALLAAALLAHRKRGVTAKDVGARIHFLRELAQREGARLSKVMEHAPSDPTTLGPINESARLFMEDGTLKSQVVGGDCIYSVPDDRRVNLAFYKNTLVHLVVARSLVSSALLSIGTQGPTAEVKDRALFLSRLLKLEFMFKVGTTFDALFAEAVEALVREGLLLDHGELLQAAPEPHVRGDLQFLRDLTNDFVESYRTVAAVLGAAEQGVEKKDLLRQAIDRGRADFLAGTLTMAESVSRPNYENAVAYFLDTGALVEQAEGSKTLVLGDAMKDEGARRELVAKIDRFLGLQ